MFTPRRYTAVPKIIASSIRPSVGTTISGFSASVCAVSTAKTAITSTSASQRKVAKIQRAVGETCRSVMSAIDTPPLRTDTIIEV